MRTIVTTTRTLQNSSIDAPSAIVSDFSSNILRAAESSISQTTLMPHRRKPVPCWCVIKLKGQLQTINIMINNRVLEIYNIIYN